MGFFFLLYLETFNTKCKFSANCPETTINLKYRSADIPEYNNRHPKVMIFGYHISCCYRIKCKSILLPCTTDFEIFILGEKFLFCRELIDTIYYM